ncbi:MAG TPA: FTR1 family protein, partial [Longimicrobiales bacterium]|nr:FTR1 family protein [Longimicrobiales bacterium]
PNTPEGDLDRWVADIRSGIEPLAEQARTDAPSAQRQALDLYVTRQEYIEMYYGPGGRLQASAELGAEIEKAEAHFHELMQRLGAKPVDVDAAARAIAALDAQQATVLAVWQKEKTRLDRSAAAATAAVANSIGNRPLRTGRAETREIRDISAAFAEAAQAYESGDAERARALVLSTYLDKFEPMESRLPSGVANRIEHLIHVEIRPSVERGAEPAAVAALFHELDSELLEADDHLQQGGTFWFAAVNSFVIILREGLEAVLLIGALLGYLVGVGASARYRRQIWAGVAAGVVATLITWGVASVLVPISGANRELIEGATALIAVAVLLYVSNWLFQKTYIHDWKNYLRERLNSAVTSKSAFAMTFLAFAAVYREGFETVLFYQALAFDASATAVFTGFVPGMVLITIVGALIIRAGARLPLKQMFAITNSVLVYLSFVFVGKGLYNLHEAGVFAARQLPLPDVQVLELMLGWYPLLETTVAQIAYLTLIAATFLFYRRRMALSAARTAVSSGS